MKKTIKILGVFALSAMIFSVNNKLEGDKIISLDSLIMLNTANAEGGGGSHTCYTTETGTSNLAYDCSDCKQIKCGASLTNKSTCTTS